MKYNYYKRFLINSLKEIRKPMGSLNPSVETTHLYFEKTLLPPIGSEGIKKNYMMPFLILVTPPCSHLLRCGGCTMCGYSNLAIFEQNIGTDIVYDQFKRGLEVIRNLPHEMIAIGTAGSFLDSDEIPYDTQSEIIRTLDSSQDIHYINIESRAEYITKESIENIVRAVNDPYKLSVGIGLESSNDLVRELCVNKSMRISSFTQSLKRLKEYIISPTVYVVLGKPFIDEWANIIDALESLEFAFNQGADRVVLLLLGIQPNSLIEWLYLHDLYKPSKIWAMVEVIKRIPEELREHVLIADPRLPKRLEVEECACAQTAAELLSEYKGSLDYSYIDAIEKISCPHKTRWYQKLEDEKIARVDVKKQLIENYSHWMNVWREEHGEIF